VHARQLFIHVHINIILDIAREAEGGCFSPNSKKCDRMDIALPSRGRLANFESPSAKQHKTVVRKTALAQPVSAIRKRCLCFFQSAAPCVLCRGEF